MIGIFDNIDKDFLAKAREKANKFKPTRIK